ncbi:LutC/YkgG family protein [Halobacillus campisalis]|uniref:Lactate utilization protein C n=1 Tax=Halobacillus campisalis TaxID=435909 RepID=A0ABW2JZE2_9BACI|nr:lactate utilization protein C [Halobacillus campisalis]
MTIHHRESFLEGLADQLGRPRKTTVEPPAYSVKPQERVLAGASPDELVDVLEKQCEFIHTSFEKATVETLPQTIRAILNGNDVTRVVAAGGPRNQVSGMDQFYDQLRTEGLEVLVWDEQQGREQVTFAEKAGAGIVFSDLTLAESGTVTLFNDRYNGRSISLLPETFIAIIPKSTLVPRMTQAARLIHSQEAKGNPVSSCVSFVTGPSNSADIEMNLIVGVHGPVKAAYIVVGDL